MGNKKNRIDEENYNNYGTLMKIFEYNNANDMVVEFQDKYRAKVHTNYRAFKKGNIKNPYDKTVFNIGYLGIGKYKTKENKKETKCSQTWRNMLQRCYDPYYINKYPTYINCYVCEEWLCFQNFAKWFYKHYYEISSERMHLDKDILVKGNKIYSSKTCIFVPSRINALFVKRQNDRGDEYIGVHWNKSNENFVSNCNILNKDGQGYTKFLGVYNTELEAFLVYKNFKENYIKQVADEYKELIPIELYEALYVYQIEIND